MSAGRTIVSYGGRPDAKRDWTMLRIIVRDGRLRKRGRLFSIAARNDQYHFRCGVIVFVPPPI